MKQIVNMQFSTVDKYHLENIGFNDKDKQNEEILYCLRLMCLFPRLYKQQTLMPQIRFSYCVLWPKLQRS